LLLPIVVGVIGHRDLREEELDRISDSLTEILRDVQAQAGTTPVWLLTSLAEGADQLAAEVAGDLDIPVLALLPMPASEYATDFAAGAPRDRFQALLARSARVLLADDLVLEGIDLSGEAYADPEQRNRAYRRCARLLSDCSHLLIGVWDGKPADQLGGTADTLAYRVPGARPLAVEPESLWSPLGGVTIHLPAGRTQHGDPAQAWRGSGPVLNPQVVSSIHDDREWVPGTADALVHHTMALNAALTARSQRDGMVAALLNVADAQALTSQTRFRRLSAAVLICGVLSLLAVNLEQAIANRWLLGSMATILVVTVLLWWVLSRAGIRDRFQEARALAEGARVQLAWLQSGVTTCVADSYLLGLPDLAWIRRTLRSAWLVDIATASPIRHEQSLAAAEQWMSGQVAYFTGTPNRAGAIQRTLGRARRYERIAFIGVAAAIVALFIDAVRSIAPIVPEGLAISGQLVWEAGLSVAAACTAYGQLMAFRETARRYQVARDVLSQAPGTCMAREPQRRRNSQTHLNSLLTVCLIRHGSNGSKCQSME